MTLRSIWRHKARSGLTVLGILIAIAAIVSLGSISEGIGGLVEGQLKFASGFISVQEAGQQSMANGPPGIGTKIDIAIVEEVKQIDGVLDAVPQIFAISPKNNIFVVGIPLGDLEYFNLQNIGFKEGGLPDDSGAKEVVVGYKLSESNGLRVGDSLELSGESYTVVGVFEELSNFIDFAAITSYDAAAETFDYIGYASTIIVEPTDINVMKRIATEIEDRYDDLKADTPEDRANTARESINTISIFTLGIGVVASLVASIGIINTMVMIVLERRKEFGIMKALGAQRETILSMVVQEAAVLGIIGGVIGVILGYFGTSAVNMSSPYPIASVSSRLVIISLAYSVILAVLAALYPAYQAIKVDAVEAMRSE